MTRLPVGITINTNTVALIKPNAPTGLASSNITKTSLTLTWSAATVPTGGSAVTGYRVYQDGALIATPTGLTTNVTSLTAGASYAFAVSAINADGEGARSTVLTVTTTAGGGLPGAPSSFRTTSTPTINSAAVAWNAGTADPTDATQGYRIYLTGGTTPMATVTGATTLATTLTGLASESSFSVIVKAYNVNGESSASNTLTFSTLSQRPSQVTGLAVVSGTLTQTGVTLQWNAATVPAGAPAITGYQVYQNNVQIRTVSTLTTAISGLTAGTTYTFKVAAVSGAGVGNASTDLSVTTVSPVVGGPPGTPTNFRTTSTPTSNSVALAWTAGTPDTNYPTIGYRVYRSTGTVLGTFSAASGTLTGLSASTTYLLTVKAYNNYNGGTESAASNQISVTTAAGGTSTGTRRFRLGNYWEKKLPDNSPVHPSNSAFISNMAAGGSYIVFVGGAGFTTSSNFWPAQYKPTSSDPLYHISVAAGQTCAAEFLPGGPGIRIPTVAKQYYPKTSTANDSPMMFYVPTSVSASGRPYYAWAAMLLWEAGAARVGTDSDTSGRWRLEGTGAQMGIYYMDSYGHSADPLKAGTIWPDRLTTMNSSGALVQGVDPHSYQDEPDNGLFRGCNSMIRAIDYDRVQDEGECNYVMELFKGNETAGSGRWPMTGFESNAGTVPEGTRMRIKASVNVANVLAGDNQFSSTTSKAYKEALAIAKGLQDYGFIVADNSGSGHHIKLTNTAKEGRGNLWSMTKDGLRSFPFNTNIWEVVDDDFDPPIT